MSFIDLQTLMIIHSFPALNKNNNNIKIDSVVCIDMYI